MFMLQEAFFGKELLSKSKQTKSALETGLVEKEASHADSKSESSSFLDPLSDPLLRTTSTPVSSKAGPLRMFSCTFICRNVEFRYIFYIYICYIYVYIMSTHIFYKYTHTVLPEKLNNPTPNVIFRCLEMK